MDLLIRFHVHLYLEMQRFNLMHGKSTQSQGFPEIFQRREGLVTRDDYNFNIILDDEDFQRGFCRTRKGGMLAEALAEDIPEAEDSDQEEEHAQQIPAPAIRQAQPLAKQRKRRKRKARRKARSIQKVRLPEVLICSQAVRTQAVLLYKVQQQSVKKNTSAKTTWTQKCQWQNRTI